MIHPVTRHDLYVVVSLLQALSICLGDQYPREAQTMRLRNASLYTAHGTYLASQPHLARHAGLRGDGYVQIGGEDGTEDG